MVLTVLISDTQKLLLIYSGVNKFVKGGHMNLQHAVNLVEIILWFNSSIYCYLFLAIRKN